MQNGDRYSTSIIGGGLLGLAMAYYLSKNGHEKIVIIEKDDRLGGACSWTDVGGTTVDRFYHVALADDSRFFKLMDDLGLGGYYGFGVAKMGIFDGAVSHSISAPCEFLAYPGISAIDKLRLLYTLLYSRFYSDWRRLERLSVPEWLIAIGGMNNYRSIWRPIIRAKFGDSVEELTAVDIWARINRLSASRRKDLSQKMAYIKGTPKTLIDRLEDHLARRGVTIVKGNGAEKIISDKNIIKDISLKDGSRLESDRYIFTTPIPEFEAILPDEYSEYKDKLKRVRYLSNMSLVLKLKKPLTPFYMLNIRDPEVPFTGIIGFSNICSPAEFDNNAVFYISKYLFDDDLFFRKNGREVLDTYMPYLKKINPEFDESWILGFALSKGRSVEPLRVLNYSKLVPQVKTVFDNGLLVTSAQFYPDQTILNTTIKVAEEFAGSL